MRRKYVEIVMSIGAVGLILLVLISFDSRVREEAARHWESGLTVELVAAAQQVRHVTDGIAKGAHDRGLSGTPVLLFLLGAGVLVVLMVRT